MGEKEAAMGLCKGFNSMKKGRQEEESCPNSSHTWVFCWITISPLDNCDAATYLE